MSHISPADYNRRHRRILRRTVSDDQIREARNAGLTSGQACQAFGVSSATINRLAARIAVSFPKRPRRQWSEQDDDIVRDVAGGRIALIAALRRLKVGSAALRARAKAIGVSIRSNKPRCGTLVADGAIHHEQNLPCLSVGEDDHLLEKLREVHGTPRNEIYPGSDGPVQRIRPEPSW